jgi:predicted transposase/invertase (TIGR01784 family)
MLFTEFNIDIAKEVWQEEAREDALLEGIVKGRAEGRTEGRAEGRAESAIDFARKLLRRGRPLSEILEDTGLTSDEIECLRDEN